MDRNPIDFSQIKHPTTGEPYMFTPKMLTALHHYVIYGNKVKAYMFAYESVNQSEKTAYHNAKRLFAQWYMKEAVALVQLEALARQNMTAEKIVIDAAWVLERAALLANFNIKKFIVVPPEGMAYYDFSTATDDDWYCISEYTVDVVPKGSGDQKFFADRVKLKTVDKLKALELVGRHIDVQAFKDQVEQSGTVTNVIMGKEEYKEARQEVLNGDDC